MAKEIIEKVLDIEKTCEKNLEEAKNKAESIVLNANEQSKANYDLSIKKAKDEMLEKINDATDQAKKAIENAESEALLQKDKLVSDVKSKQEKAMKEIIDMLV